MVIQSFLGHGCLIMIVMVKSSVNGARKERMTIMDIAACVKWTLNVTMLASPTATTCKEEETY